MKQNSNSHNDNIIVIGGGVGPSAGVDLHRLIIEETKDAVSDQDHLRVIHLSFSDLIADRTQALKNNTTKEVADSMAHLIISVIPTCKVFNARKMVVGIPCNTFHASPIFNQFLLALNPHKEFITVVDMISETTNHVATLVKLGETIGIMSTTGTRNSKLYDNMLTSIGYKPLHCDDQQAIHSSIYNKEWGLKAVNGASVENKEILYNGLEELYQKGAKAIILACTEIPLAIKEAHYKGVTLINPVTILATSLIREVRENT